MGQLGSLGPCWRPATQRVKCLVKSASCLAWCWLCGPGSSQQTQEPVLCWCWLAAAGQRGSSSVISPAEYSPVVAAAATTHNSRASVTLATTQQQHNNSTNTNVTRPSFDVQPSDGGADSVTAPGRG